MKVAILAPICWRTPPLHYGPWEQVASNIAEGMVGRGLDVTLFATGNSKTRGRLEFVSATAYEEDKDLDPKVSECLHIGYAMEQAHKFDLIHNNYDFLPLTYTELIKTPVLTTIHGFSSPKIIPVYKRYNERVHYVSISNSDRCDQLEYAATVYNGINKKDFTFRDKHGDYLLFFGRIHSDKGTYESIQIAKKYKMKLIISGLIQDKAYFDQMVAPYVNGDDIVYVGSSGPKQRDELLGNAYALLHPISFEEPFGLSVAESMFCGTPVVAFKRGSMPELIDDGRSGFLVQNVDEAVQVLDQVKSIDPKYCRDLAQSRFSIEKMIDDYLEVYKTILK